MTMLIELLRYDGSWTSVSYSSLSPAVKVFLLLLALLTGYTLYVALVALVGLRSLRSNQNDNSLRSSIALLTHRTANLRQSIVAMVYLFVVVFFMHIQNAYWTPENNRPVGLMVLENFRVYFSFGAFIFLAFLALHSVQWFVSARIRKATLRLDTQVIV